VREIVWTSAFTRSFRKVVRSRPDLRSVIEAVLRQLTEDPFHPTLHSHKLKGPLRGVWACTVEYDFRILFEFIQETEAGDEVILLLTIGTHDEVY